MNSKKVHPRNQLVQYIQYLYIPTYKKDKNKNKIQYLYIPIIVNQQIWGLQVTMNNCWHAGMQAVHTFCLHNMAITIIYYIKGSKFHDKKMFRNYFIPHQEPF